MNLLRSAPGRAGASAIVALGLWAILARALPYGAPTGIILAGAVMGAINGLVVIAVILVYRANRILNFAAAEFGSVAAVTAIELHIQLHLNYFLCIATGLVAAAVIGAILEVTVVRRFGQAPRLIMTVATIGLAQVLNGLSILIPVEWSQGHNSGTFDTPWNVHFRIFPVLFDGNYVLALVTVPVVLVALTWFMRYTSYGIAIRAAADNGDRARLLGVPVNRLSTIVWTITGVLSALAALLRVPILGFLSFSSVSDAGPVVLLQVFAAAVIGGMTSLPIGVLAAVGLGVEDQLSSWTLHNSSLSEATLLVFILGAMFLQRKRLTRAAETGISTWQAIKQIRPIPPELNRFIQVRLAAGGTRLALLGVALGLPFVLTPARTQLASVILIYAVVAASLVILVNWGGNISLGHIAFMGFGAAVTGTLIAHHNWDMFLALAAGAGVTAVLALILGLPALRIPGLYLAVVTLAFAVTSADYFLVPRYFSWLVPTDPVNRPNIFGRLATGTDKQIYYLCLVALAIVLAAVRGMRHSHAGRSLLATTENRLATQSFGINTTRLQLMAFAVSGGLAGLAGGLFVIQQEGFNNGSFGIQDGLFFFMMVVIGGMGSIAGAVMGAVFVYGAQYLLPPQWSFIATGAFMVILLMVFPGGLGAVVFSGRDSLLRWYAKRRGVIVPSLVADQRETGTDAPAVPVPEPVVIDLTGEDVSAGARTEAERATVLT